MTHSDDGADNTLMTKIPPTTSTLSMLNYWQRRAEHLEETLAKLDGQLESLKLDRREHFKSLQDAIHFRTEYEKMKDELSDAHVYLHEEKRHMLGILAENDALKCKDILV
jgi:hypothetical protein